MAVIITALKAKQLPVVIFILSPVLYFFNFSYLYKIAGFLSRVDFIKKISENNNVVNPC